MKRLALILLLATSAFGADKWADNYKKGVAAVNGRNYRLGADLLQKAVAEKPTEALSVRSGREILTSYVPHFFLGIAKFNLGDVDGALREWRLSEEQGAIARTDYYANMKNWVARAQTEKVRLAENAASGSKKAADTAISKAMLAKSDAFSQGGERTESYRNGQRKITEARSQFEKAGTDAAAFRVAETKAGEATALFNAAAEEGKKLRAAQAARPAKKPPQPEVVVEYADLEVVKPTPPKTETVAPPKVDPVPPPPVVEKKPEVIPTPVPAPVAPSPELRAAYRAFAAGDLAGSEQLLTRLLRQRATGEAYLLRGCTRYTRAMLSRAPEALLASAAADFRAALARNRALRLDPRAFSPKLVAFFEQQRK
jgi:hypothetical protein